MENQLSLLIKLFASKSSTLYNKISFIDKPLRMTRNIKKKIIIQNFKKNQIGFTIKIKNYKRSLLNYLFYPSIVLCYKKIIKDLKKINLKKSSDLKYRINILQKINIELVWLKFTLINIFLNKRSFNYYKKMDTSIIYKNKRFYPFNMVISNSNF